MCGKGRIRSACAFAQANQCLFFVRMNNRQFPAIVAVGITCGGIPHMKGGTHSSRFVTFNLPLLKKVCPFTARLTDRVFSVFRGEIEAAP